MLRGRYPRGEDGYNLIKHLAKEWILSGDINLMDTESMVIEKDSKGKPHFKNSNIHFSLSHSGDYWLCLFSFENCGLDVQEIRECSFEAIAKRHFKEKEITYVKEKGLEGFFDIWVRKEALGKLIGEGVWSPMPKLVGEKMELLSVVHLKEKAVNFKTIQLGKGVKCAFCKEMGRRLK